MRDKLRLYMKGVPMEVPQWVLLLEAAGGDLLKAMELEGQVTERWWGRYMMWREARTDG